MKILAETSLKPFHTFALNVHAKKIIQADDAKDFVQIWQEHENEPKLLLGQGSNVLFCDDFDGVVVLNRLKGIAVKDTPSAWLLHVAGGENWHDLVRWTLENGMSGLENLALIPGLVGSAPIQNIGAYGVEFCQRCDYVDVLMIATGKIERLTAAECEFGYRDSIFKRQLKDLGVIVAVGLSLPKLWTPIIAYGALATLSEQRQLSPNTPLTPKDVFNRVCDIRRAKLPDPAVFGNAGSFFKNPMVSIEKRDALLADHQNMPFYPIDNKGRNSTHVKLAAGWLVEHAGLKGYHLGRAAVHEKQALVLINTGGATGADVVKLAQVVVDTVAKKFGVTLTPEVRFMGKTCEITLSDMRSD